MDVALRNALIIEMREKGHTLDHIAKKFKLSKSGVFQIVNGNRSVRTGEKTQQLVQELKRTEAVEKETLFDIIRSVRFSDIVYKAVNILDNVDNLNKEFEERGIGNLYRLVGVLTDKSIALEQLEIKKRELEIKERELEIRLKELELRIQRPEAFHEVHIINDAPKEPYASAN